MRVINYVELLSLISSCDLISMDGDLYNWEIDEEIGRLKINGIFIDLEMVIDSEEVGDITIENDIIVFQCGNEIYNNCVYVMKLLKYMKF